MLALLVLALAAPPVPVASPSPVASPAVLQEIGRVRSRAPLCATLRDAVAPSVLALLKSDSVLAAGHDTMITMGKHEIYGWRTKLEFDRIALDHQIVAIVGNLKTIDSLLANRSRFPKTATTDDERRALEIKAQLQRVAKAQNDALNVISGVLQTDRLGQMQTDFPKKIDAATGREGSHADQPGTAATDPDLGPVSYLGVAGAKPPDYSGNPANAAPGSSLSQSGRASGLSGFGVPTDIYRNPTTTGLSGRTLYDAMASELNGRRIPVDQLEHAASQTIIAAAQRCSAEPPPAMPMPAAQPSP